MSDIVERLNRAGDLAIPGEPCAILYDAANEIERLRLAIRRLAEQDATLSVQGGNVTVTMDGTLTDEEREAIVAAVAFFSRGYGTTADTLRGLLERLGPQP